MTVAARTSHVSYAENGVTASFPAPFRYKDPSHLVVERIAANGTITTLAYGPGFTATPGPTDAGGTVTPVVISDDTILRISRFTPRAQTTEYITADRFPAVSVEQSLDTDMLIDQEQDDALAALESRTLRVPDGEIVSEFPDAAHRAMKLAWFDETGDAAVIDPEDILDVLSDFDGGIDEEPDGDVFYGGIDG